MLKYRRRLFRNYMDVIGFCGIGTMRMSLLFIGEVSLSSLHATSHLSYMQTPNVQLVTCISCILQHVNTCNHHPLCYHALHEKCNLSYMHNGHVSCYKSRFTNHNIGLGSSFGPIPFTVLSLDHNLRRFTFPTLLPSHAPCKNAKITLGPDFIFQPRLLVIFGF